MAKPLESLDVAIDEAALELISSETRGKLISKGMVFSPSRGDTSFTVPLFDEFMPRLMPGEDWLAA